MTGSDERFDAGPAWPGPPEGELRPFRAADAKAARDRRTGLRPNDAHDDVPWLEEMSVDLLEHLTVLGDLVTTTTDGSRKQMNALALKINALNAAVEELTAELRGLPQGNRNRPPSLSREDLEALADVVATKLQASFRVVPPHLGGI